MKAAVILCGLTDSAARDHRPALGLLEQSHHVGMYETHAACFGQMANLIGRKRQTLGIAECSESARDQIPDLECGARPVGNQQRHSFRHFFDQAKDGRNAVGGGNARTIDR